MAKQTINIGASPNDGTGTPLRTSFDYCNQNFTEIYTALGGGVALPGATTQVIFNDGGTNLAGDAGLVYNKTTDALTVAGLVTAGSATITGALTTQGTQVKLANQAAADCTVLIGPDSPSSTRSGRIGFITSSTEKNWFIANNWNVPGGFEITQSTAAGGSTLSANPTFRISNNSDFLFLDGAGGTRMTLNSFGLGIGIASSGGKLVVRDAGGNDSYIGYGATNDIYLSSGSTGSHYFRKAAASAAMTLDASGNLLVARTSAGLTNGTGVTIGQSSIGMQTEGNAIQIIANRTTSDGIIIDIRRNNLSVGNIAVTTLATTYNSISDYRLKESVKPISGGLARVNALKPSIYNWKANGSAGEGFLAHELAQVVPAAVTGEKDAVNEDGSVNAQSIDMSRVVPILVAAIQELTARVQTLEAR